MKRKDVPARAQELNRDLVQALEELDEAYRAVMRYIVLNLYEGALRKFILITQAPISAFKSRQ